MSPPRFLVSYEDDDYLFGEGDRRCFGRDDESCAIPVWAEIRRTRLSAVAGEMWCMDGEMWLRNLSTAHEIEVSGPDGPPQYLPVRRADERGAARSLPAPRCRVGAPSTGTWQLSVVALDLVGSPVAATARPTTVLTTRLGPVPEHLLVAAAALCHPVLTHDRAPASYDEIARRLAISPRQARRRIEELVSHYRRELPDLFEDDQRGGPLYAELARLLVRRRCITVDDLALVTPVPT